MEYVISDSTVAIVLYNMLQTVAVHCDISEPPRPPVRGSGLHPLWGLPPGPRPAGLDRQPDHPARPARAVADGRAHGAVAHGAQGLADGGAPGQPQLPRSDQERPHAA